MSTTTLRYEGGADLSFRDASNAKRRVLRGATFEVDDATAAILLATDDKVSVVEPEGSARNDPAEGLAAYPYAGLQGIARELGIASGGSRDALEGRIREELERREPSITATTSSADEPSGLDDDEPNEGGNDEPADDPVATAAGEAGTPPAASGAITLGDLPSSARVAGSPSEG